MEGANLVLESDGSQIDDDEVLLCLNKETFILLQENEVWLPEDILSRSTISELSELLPIQSSSTNFFREIESPSTISEISTRAESLVGTPMGPKSHSNLEFIWDNFNPFTHIQQKLNIVSAKTKYINTEVVHVIVDEMRKIKTAIPNIAFKVVAKKLAEKYPTFFRDVDEDGAVIGDGTHTIFAKLQDRNNYLNRPHKRPRGSTSGSLLKIRKQLDVKTGCPNWEPEVQLDVEEVHVNADTDESQYLETTYPLVRQFLNDLDSPPTAVQIKEKWPVLLQRDAIIWHFHKLTDIRLENLEICFSQKATKIVNFGIQKKYLEEFNENRKYEDTLIFFAKYFKEDLKYIYYQFKVRHIMINIQFK